MNAAVSDGPGDLSPYWNRHCILEMLFAPLATSQVSVHHQALAWRQAVVVPAGHAHSAVGEGGGEGGWADTQTQTSTWIAPWDPM